jgi:ligand-binding SRPBCC domain-containing protein
MKLRVLETEMWLPLPIKKVFAFFGDARNLAEITPPWLHFQILTPMPVEMKAGTLLDYRLRVRGLPLRWQTEILEWDPPHRFVDRQNRGPYRQWLHTHTFEERDGGTLIRDRVEYAVPGWIFEPIVHGCFVGPDIRKIFEYRREKVAALLAAVQDDARTAATP